MTGLVIVPTRNRPEAALELVRAFSITRAYGYAHLLFAVDDDDPQLEQYLTQLDDVAVDPRTRIGPTLNRLAMENVSHYDWLGFMGDDHRPRTVGWAEGIDLVLKRRPGVAYGDDLIQGAALPTAAFVSSKLVRQLGYLVPPGLKHMYLDNFWLELGKATHLHYLSHMVFEHLHPLAGKAEWSEQYADVNGLMAEDHAVFQAYMRDSWPTERLRLV